jgi:GcrA cell cycle regulator
MSRWTPEKTEQLRQLWADGYSCSQIAGRLGGLTRNAVIGRIHRLGLAGRATTSRTPHPRRSTKRKPMPAMAPSPASPVRQLVADGLPIPPPADTDIARVSFIDLEAQHCRFIVLKEPAGPYVKQFCGADKLPGLSWCPDHARRCLNLERPLRHVVVHSRPLQVA